MSIRPRSRHSVAGIGALAIGLVLLSGGVAFGGDPYSGVHTGDVGDHWLRDSPEFGGVTCYYTPVTFNELAAFRIRPPVMHAFDRTPGTDMQWVGWKYRIQGSDDNTSFTLVTASDMQKARTSDKQAARFTKRNFALASRDYLYYRVLIRMFWLEPGHPTNENRADHFVQWYRQESAGPGTFQGSCFGDGD